MKAKKAWGAIDSDDDDDRGGQNYSVQEPQGENRYREIEENQSNSDKRPENAEDDEVGDEKGFSFEIFEKSSFDDYAEPDHSQEGENKSTASKEDSGSKYESGTSLVGSDVGVNFVSLEKLKANLTVRKILKNFKKQQKLNYLDILSKCCDLYNNYFVGEDNVESHERKQTKQMIMFKKMAELVSENKSRFFDEKVPLPKFRAVEGDEEAGETSVVPESHVKAALEAQTQLLLEFCEHIQRIQNLREKANQELIQVHRDKMEDMVFMHLGYQIRLVVFFLGFKKEDFANLKTSEVSFRTF